MLEMIHAALGVVSMVPVRPRGQGRSRGGLDDLSHLKVDPEWHPVVDPTAHLQRMGSAQRLVRTSPQIIKLLMHTTEVVP